MLLKRLLVNRRGLLFMLTYLRQVSSTPSKLRVIFRGMQNPSSWHGQADFVKKPKILSGTLR